ncbi:hypothetical protein BJX76DRAFT_353746 [Aspergillus varians]
MGFSTSAWLRYRSISKSSAHFAFLGLLSGFFLGAAVKIANQRFYNQRFQANNNRPVPDARLPPMMVSSTFFATGLFILGWTSEPEIFWFCPICGTISTGLDFFTIFQAALNYLIDTFQKYSASAVAVNPFLRSVFAGCFPPFANAMFHKLGTAWASSLLGFVAGSRRKRSAMLYRKSDISDTLSDACTEKELNSERGYCIEYQA